MRLWHNPRCSKSRAALALLAVAGTTFSACNLRPLYAGGTSGVIPTALGKIDIEPIAGKSGWLVHNALRDQLEAFEGSQSKYRLIICCFL